MNWILKHKIKTERALLVALFLVFSFGIFFLQFSKVEAASCRCDNGVVSSATVVADTNTEMECNNACIAKSLQRYEYNGGAWTNITNGNTSAPAANSCWGGTKDASGKCICDGSKGYTLGSNGNCVYTAEGTASDNTNPDAGTKKDIYGRPSGIGELLLDAFIWLLQGILKFLGWLFSIAATIFSFAVDPKTMSDPSVGLLNSQGVQDVWVMVRDFLNMFFILILLFSAFGTIFQVDNFNFKKIWFKIVINALLVNFSFPIARFIIDISNVAMYYFLNNMFAGSGASDPASMLLNIANVSKLNGILEPTYKASDDQIPYLIASIVFVFILGMTLMVLAVMFLIRLIALAMIVMFSPIGFVGYIFPSTSGWAKKWWDNLFKYSFFGPVMVFMMLIALKLMEVAQSNNFQTMVNKAGPQGVDANQSTWIAQAAFFTIPILVLWMGMGTAQSWSIAGAGKVLDKVKKGGSWLANLPVRGMKYGWGATGVPGTYKKAVDNFKKDGKLFGKRIPLMGTKYREEREDRMAGLIGGYREGYNAVRQNQDAAKVKDVTDKKDTVNMTENDLIKLKDSGDKFEKAAAILELASRGKANAKDLDYAKGEFGDTSKVFNQLRNKVKTYDPTAAFATSVDAAGNVTAFDHARMKEFINSNQFDSKKLNADSLKNAAFVEMAFTEGGLKPKEIEELAGRSKTHSDNIKSALGSILNQKEVDINGNVMRDRSGNEIYKYQNMDNESQRNMQMSFLAQSGKLHDSMLGGFGPDDVAKRAKLLSRAGKDDLKRLKSDFISATGNLGLVNEIANNVSPGKVKDILMDMNKESQSYLMRKIRTQDYSATSTIHNPNAETIQKQLNDDPQMKNMHTS